LVWLDALRPLIGSSRRTDGSVIVNITEFFGLLADLGR
jgi:hypothetical protein